LPHLPHLPPQPLGPLPHLRHLRLQHYRLEGRLAALADDKVGALRAYGNYLRLRVDPEPSRVPQLDSVRAEIRALGGVEGER